MGCLIHSRRMCERHEAYANLFTQFSNITNFILVPRGCAPFGQYQESRPWPDPHICFYVTRNKVSNLFDFDISSGCSLYILFHVVPAHYCTVLQRYHSNGSRR